MPRAEQRAAPVRVGIILYVNRSGSTKLARTLGASLEDVFVFPELRFTLEVLARRRARRPVCGDELSRLMRDDPRLAGLVLSDAQLAIGVARYAAGGLHALLTALATAALGKRPAAMILKLESYLAFVPELDEVLGAPVLIHALRDPRAVVRSMRATPVPEKPGFDMARGSLVYAARHWRDYVAGVAALAATPRPVITARYEAPAASLVSDIANALGVRLGAGDGARFAVAPLDAALHRHVDEPFDRSRAHAWRRDLTADEIALVEALCAPEMRRAGYQPIADRPLGTPALLAALARHYAATVRHAARTALAYGSRPGGLRQLAARLRLARAARRR